MIKTLLLIFYNILRFGILKCIHRNKVNIHWLQRISPFCAIKLFGNGSITIGQNTEFAAYCDHEVHGEGKISIGNKVYMNRFCMISAHDSVTIGNNCLFGPGVKIFDNNHQYNPQTGVSTNLNSAPILIGNNCWIASNVVILKGSKIGDNCVIGAGCIIHGTIPSGSIVKNKQEINIS